jgi:hypothetical protein
MGSVTGGVPVLNDAGGSTLDYSKLGVFKLPTNSTINGVPVNAGPQSGAVLLSPATAQTGTAALTGGYGDGGDVATNTAAAPLAVGTRGTATGTFLAKFGAAGTGNFAGLVAAGTAVVQTVASTLLGLASNLVGFSAAFDLYGNLGLLGGLFATSVSTPNTNGVLGIFHVRDFGATGNGTTDDTAAIRAACAAATPTGGIVLFPPGNYLVSATISLTQAVSLEGCGPGAATLLCATGFAGDVVQIAQAYCNVTGLAFNTQNATTRASTAGSFISTNAGFSGASHDCVVSDCSFINYNLGVTIEGTNLFFLHNCQFGTGRYAITSGRVYASGDVFVSHCWGQTASTTAPVAWVQLGGTVNGVAATGPTNCSLGGFAMHDCEWNGGANGMILDCTNNGPLGSSFVSHCFFDSNNNNNLYALAGASYSPSMWEFANCWFATARISSAIILNGADGFSFTNCSIVNGYQNGLFLLGGTKNTLLSNCTVLAHNAAGASSAYGAAIFVQVATATVIVGCNLSTNTTFAFSRQSYCIAIDNTQSSGCIVEGCIFGGYTVAAYLLAAAVSGSSGYVAPVRFSHNIGLNPGGAGSSPPAVPASGTACPNPYPFDCTVYTVGGSITSVAISGRQTSATGASSVGASQTLTVAAGTPLRVCAGESITLNYTGSPAWAWRLD